MGHVFHRNPKHAYPVAVGGDGPYVIDSDGKRYLDACCGAAVSCLGHSDREVIGAIKAQQDQIPFAHTSFFTNQPMELLADELIESAPEGMARVYFCSGGSEAVEAALKLARQYFVEIGQSERSHVIARRQSYHGNTLGALATGGNLWRRKQFEPLLVKVSHVAPCYTYRGKQQGETDTDYGRRLVRELEEEVLRLGQNSVIAFVAETVGGATLGCVTPVPGYFKGVRAVCDKYGILLILDEVMCGMGRCGTLYACEQEDVVPDLVCIGKGLGAGYQPIGALLASAKIYDAVVNGSGFFQHGHTYTGHATACAGALAVQRAVKQRGLLATVRERGAGLEARLRARLGAHPHVGEIRGRGLFWALELVQERASKQPFDAKRKINARLKLKALENGLMCYPMGGTVDGLAGDHVMLAPPFIISEAQLDEAVDKLARSIDEVIAAS
ncbi:MAG: aspartate aminotransferase family protein [Betaproteobacteria bacterium]|nr:MAG: aspartate aminotransferase family protein [Betaproteobacteria bacterium]